MRLKSTVKQAARAIGNTFSSADTSSATSDILHTLKKEHDEVKGLLKELSNAEKPAQRRALVLKIKAALVPHTKAEEKVVYDAVIALRDKDAQRDGYEGYLEHEWASKTLQRLDAELDARAHLSRGPRRSQFKRDMAAQGLKSALRNRDAPFGDGMVRLAATKSS